MNTKPIPPHPTNRQKGGVHKDGKGGRKADAKVDGKGGNVNTELAVALGNLRRGRDGKGRGCASVGEGWV